MSLEGVVSDSRATVKRFSAYICLPECFLLLGLIGCQSASPHVDGLVVLTHAEMHPHSHTPHHRGVQAAAQNLFIPVATSKCTVSTNYFPIYILCHDISFRAGDEHR